MQPGDEFSKFILHTRAVVVLCFHTGYEVVGLPMSVERFLVRGAVSLADLCEILVARGDAENIVEDLEAVDVPAQDEIFFFRMGPDHLRRLAAESLFVVDACFFVYLRLAQQLFQHHAARRRAVGLAPEDDVADTVQRYLRVERLDQHVERAAVQRLELALFLVVGGGDHDGDVS